MRRAGEPVTSKRIADTLGISPSSARHHLIKLQEIGLVQHDHYETINGIRADYLSVVDADVSIGVQTDDELYDRREQTTRQMLSDIVERFFAAMPRLRKNKMKKPEIFNGDLFTGMVHLNDEDSREFYTMVRTFLDTHEKKRTQDERAWEFAFLLYEAQE